MTVTPVRTLPLFRSGVGPREATAPAVAPAPVAPPRFWEPPLFVTLTFLVFVVARYMQWGARREILAKIRVEFLLGIAVLVMCIALLPSHPIRLGGNRQARNVVIGIVALFFAMIIQIPFAADPVLARKIFWDRVIKFAMLTFFMVTLIRSPRTLRWFLAAFLFACFYITQESTRGLISGGLVWQNQGIMRLHGAVPIYRHPNSLGGLAMGTIPFVVFLWPAIRRWKVRLLLVPLLVTALVCVVYSGSRTAYVALLTFLVFWWSQSRHKVRNLVVGLLIGAALLPLVPDQYIQRFESIEGQEAEGHSKAARIQIIKDAWAIFLDNPLGVGVASFPAVREQRFHRHQDTHNLYLEVATNLGVQGLAVFFFLVGSMLAGSNDLKRRLDRIAQRQLRLARGTGDPVVRRRLGIYRHDVVYLRAATTAVQGFLVVRLTLGMFGMDLYEVYWWFAAGMVLVIAGLTTVFEHSLAPASDPRRREPAAPQERGRRP